MLYNQFPFYFDQPNGVLYARDMTEQQNIEHAVADPDVKHIVTDLVHWHIPTDKFVLTFCFAEDVVNLINKEVPVTDNFETEVPVNFIYNKRQINRHIAVKLLDYFNVKAYYSYSGILDAYDMSEIIEQKKSSTITDGAMNSILQPMTRPKKWFSVKNQYVNDGAIENYGSMNEVFLNNLFPLYNKSAVSIITESVQNQRAAVITEKTLYSTYGLTFPLWVGGYGQEKLYRELGFDTFSDLINHDYQYADTLLERCWLAFSLNKDLLLDPHIGKTRQQYKDRLIKNRDYMLENPFIKWNNAMIDNMPKKLKASFEINRVRGRGY